MALPLCELEKQSVHTFIAPRTRDGGTARRCLVSGLDTGGYGRRTAAWARREGWHAPSALPAGTTVPVRGPGGSSSSRGAGSAASEAPNRLLGLPQGGMGVSPCAERPSRARQALEGRARARAVKGGHVGARAQRRDVLDRTPSRVGLGESGSTGARGETLGSWAWGAGGTHLERGATGRTHRDALGHLVAAALLHTCANKVGGPVRPMGALPGKVRRRLSEGAFGLVVVRRVAIMDGYIRNRHPIFSRLDDENEPALAKTCRRPGGEELEKWRRRTGGKAHGGRADG